jgi:tetratricopeptide (TPR) repeat protein
VLTVFVQEINDPPEISALTFTPAAAAAERETALGAAALRAGNGVEAQAAYQRALGLLPGDADVHTRLALWMGVGEALRRQGELEQAAAYYKDTCMQTRLALRGNDDLTMDCDYHYALLMAERDILGTVRELLPDVVKHYRSTRGAAAPRTLNALTLLGAVHYYAGDDTAYAELTEALQIRLDTHAGTPRLIAQLHTLLADLSYGREDFAAALTQARAGVAGWEESAPQSAEHAFALELLGQVRAAQHEYSEAEAALRHAQQIRNDTAAPAIIRARLACNLADVFFDQADLIEARLQVDAALKLLEGTALTSTHLLCRWGLAKIELADHQTAPAARALDWLLRYPARTPQEVELQVRAGMYRSLLFEDQEQGERSRRVLRLALKRQSQLQPQPDNTTSELYYRLGRSFANDGHFRQALTALQQAVAIDRQAPPANELQLAYSLAALSWAQAALKQTERAVANAREATALFAKSSRARAHTDIARAFILLGDSARGAGRPAAEVADHYQRAWLLERQFGCSERLAYSAFRLAQAQFDDREFARAEQVLREARDTLAQCPVRGSLPNWIALLLARTLQAQGNTEQAQRLVASTLPSCTWIWDGKLRSFCHTLHRDLLSEH